MCVTSISPAKTDEPIEMPFGMCILGWAQGTIGGPDPYGKGTSIPTGWPKKQSSVTLNFLNEKSPAMQPVVKTL